MILEKNVGKSCNNVVKSQKTTRPGTPREGPRRADPILSRKTAHFECEREISKSEREILDFANFLESVWCKLTLHLTYAFFEGFFGGISRMHK